MAVKIRLSRIGKKHRPFWRVVAVDSRSKRDGAFLENLGTYDPINKQLIKFDANNMEKWISNGAVCTASVIRLAKMYKKLNPSAE